MKLSGVDRRQPDRVEPTSLRAEGATGGLHTEYSTHPCLHENPYELSCLRLVGTNLVPAGDWDESESFSFFSFLSLLRRRSRWTRKCLSFQLVLSLDSTADGWTELLLSSHEDYQVPSDSLLGLVTTGMPTSYGPRPTVAPFERPQSYAQLVEAREGLRSSRGASKPKTLMITSCTPGRLHVRRAFSDGNPQRGPKCRYAPIEPWCLRPRCDL